VTATPRVTVVIPNWNGHRFLEECLEALGAQDYRDFETLVVDNGSTDGSTGLLRERFPGARVLELGENRGFAAAMNEGIRAAGTPLVAFLNNDTRVDASWLGELVSCLDRHPAAAAAASKLLIYDTKRIDGAGDCLGRLLLPYPRGHDRPDDERFADEIEVFGATGGASAWRVDVLEQMDGFDESFFAYFEDVDLSFRTRLAGYEIWYAPRSVVLHHGGGTSSAFSDFSFFHPIRNRWYLVLKNMPVPLLLLYALPLAYSEAVLWVRAVYRRKVGAMLRAYRDVGRNRARLMRQRRAIQADRRISLRRLNRLVA
jgi:GT2 family glycosyltransferase